MKKKYQYFPLIAFFAIITLLVSCSKEQVVIDKTTASAIQGSAGSKTILSKGGSLTLMVLPQEAKPIITIVNENFSSTEFYLEKGGYLTINNVPPGIYKVIIHVQNPEVLNGDWPVTADDPGYPDMVIGSVKIASGVVTNLGVIKLS